MSTDTLTKELHNLADEGTIRLDPTTGTLELKAHNEDTYTPLNLAELTDTLPEAPLTADQLTSLEEKLTNYLSTTRPGPEPDIITL